MRSHSSQQNTAHSYHSQMNICAEDVNSLIQFHRCYIQCCDQHSFRLFLATLEWYYSSSPDFHMHEYHTVCMLGACTAHVGFRHQLKFGFMIPLENWQKLSQLGGPGNETGQQCFQCAQLDLSSLNFFCLLLEQTRLQILACQEFPQPIRLVHDFQRIRPLPNALEHPHFQVAVGVKTFIQVHST